MKAALTLSRVASTYFLRVDATLKGRYYLEMGEQVL